jgi:hypothetical protein
MKQKKRIEILTPWPVRSLHWEGDQLIDWVGGGAEFSLDGESKHARVNYAYRFDRAAVLPGSEYVVLYEVLGTKGLILRSGKVVREINRSFYCANAYEYPLVLFHLPGGIAAIAHCPNKYNELVIEDLDSGKPFTTHSGKSTDFSHSRLSVSPDGNYLMSAGWIWQPTDLIQVYEIPAVLKNPLLLRESIDLPLPEDIFEMHSACFLSADEIVCCGNPESDESTPVLVRLDLKRNKTTSTIPLKSFTGTIARMGAGHLISFFEYPKLIDSTSGDIVLAWPDLNTGKQNSSIIHDKDSIPPIAVDEKNLRFAVADKTKITVIELEA